MRVQLSLQSFAISVAALLVLSGAVDAQGTRVRGEVKDAATGERVACRMYVRGEDGSWYFPEPEDKAGTAIPYKKQRANSVEMHTTLSAHPFVLSLKAGRYTFTVERGKEYLPETRIVTVGDKPLDLQFRLRRFVDMASLG